MRKILLKLLKCTHGIWGKKSNNKFYKAWQKLELVKSCIRKKSMIELNNKGIK
jgi:hypothetical protein